jgi:hypothetical protein
MDLSKYSVKVWANLSEDAKQWRVFVNTTMSLAVNKTQGIFIKVR